MYSHFQIHGNPMEEVGFFFGYFGNSEVGVVGLLCFLYSSFNFCHGYRRICKNHFTLLEKKIEKSEVDWLNQGRGCECFH